MTFESRQPLDVLMTEMNISNADLVQASTEQLSFKNVQKGRTGHRLTTNIQDKILTALLKLKPYLKLSRRDLFRYEMSEDAIEKIGQAGVLARDRKINYPQFVDLLLEAGATRYSVEVAAHRITYFGMAGEAYIAEGPSVSESEPGRYDENALRTAIADTQKGWIDYPTFLNRIYQAGIIAYDVNLRGREIRYRSEKISYKELIPLVTSIAAQTPAAKKPTPSSAATSAKKSSAKKKISVKRSVSLKARKAAKKSWNKRR